MTRPFGLRISAFGIPGGPIFLLRLGTPIIFSLQKASGREDKFFSLLERATDIVLDLVKCLRGGMDLEKVKDLNDKLQFLEGEADKYMMVLYKDLFGGKHDAIQVIALKDLYELLEKVIDRCRDAGNVIAHIALKNS
jgi:uncharacterized protein